jgi:hypothetical protein
LRHGDCIRSLTAIFLCACATPYQQAGFRGGYDDYKAGAGGAIMVTFKGNGYTSQSEVVKMWHRRAAEICGGPEQYVVLNSEKSSTVTEGPSTSTTDVTVSGNHAYATTTMQPGMTWTKHQLQGLIRCVTTVDQGAGAEAPAAAPAPAAPSSGCSKDTDCKGARICSHGECVDPP